MTWEVNGDVWVEHNIDGTARLIRHLSRPFMDTGVNKDGYGLVVAYLRLTNDLLGISNSQIDELEKSISQIDSNTGTGPLSTNNGPQLRWSSKNELRGETKVILVQQTHNGWSGAMPATQVEVEGAGLRVVLHGKVDYRITGVTSTLRKEFKFGDVPPSKDKKISGIDLSKFVLDIDIVNGVLTAFGFGVITGTIIPKPPAIYIHRYQPGNNSKWLTAGTGKAGLIADVDYLALSLRVFPPPVQPEGLPSDVDTQPYELVVHLHDGFEPLAARALFAHAAPPVATGSGLVFESDPLTETADFSLLPNASNSKLNSQRRSVPLGNLFVPTSMPQKWSLSGPNVKIEGDKTICGVVGISPPVVNSSSSFIFESRTNDFAAVNAYYHCETTFEMLEAFGLPFEKFQMGFQLPARVIHRAAILPGGCSDGNCINAQLRIIPSRLSVTLPKEMRCDPGYADKPQVQFRFALADLKRDPGTAANPLSPLGIACDVRIVWHEFCHALLAAATGYLEFPFAHSAGDALAAITCDPGSCLAEDTLEPNFRGVTFPWVAGALRRHDRKAEQGWSWSGPLGEKENYHQDIRDMFGYSREQVLSSTLFRFYQAIGGDAKTSSGTPDLMRRAAAAEYAVYLIVRAIASLGPAVTVPAVDAGAFAGALMDADVGTIALTTPTQTAIASSGRIGGTAHKVIRWAFEKQGLYVRQGARPHADGSGDAEPVDVYIDDGRQGGYQYSSSWLALSAAVWNRVAPDGLAGHEDPELGQKNYIYVRVSNRGYMDAPDAQISIYVGASVPDPQWLGAPGWAALAPLAAGTDTGAVPAGGAATLGPFVWRPTDPGQFLVLSAVDATGDRANIGAASGLPCAQVQGPIEFLVPLDNNLGLSVWDVE